MLGVFGFFMKSSKKIKDVLSFVFHIVWISTLKKIRKLLEEESSEARLFFFGLHFFFHVQPRVTVLFFLTLCVCRLKVTVF